MTYIPPNPNGQASMANSSPVVIASDQSIIPVTSVPESTSVSFTTSTVQAVGTTDATDYNSVSVQIVTQGTSSTVTFQGSNDNTNWVSIPLVLSTAVGSTIPVVSTTAASTYYGALPFRYFRLNVTGISAGTTAGVIVFKQSATTLSTQTNVSMSSGTTGPTKAEDAASATGDIGIAAMVIRRDTPVANANVSADGDYTTPAVDNLQKLWTADNQTEDAPHASGDRGAFILGVRRDTRTAQTSADGDYSPVAVDQYGNTQTINPDFVQTAQNLSTASTANAVTLSSLDGVSGVAVQITGTWTGTLILEGSVDGGTNYFTAVAFSYNSSTLVGSTTINGQFVARVAGFSHFRVRCSSTGTGTAVVSIRATIGASVVSVENTVNTIVTSALPAGTNAIGKLAANSGVDIGDVDVTSAVITGGAVAHDGVDSGNPIKVGAKASATLSDDTMVSNGDRTDLTSDIDGAVLTRPQFPLGDLISERVTDTGGTSTGFTNFGATASTKNVVTAITVYNSSATAGYIDFRDGTAGTILYTVPLPAGGGAVLSAGATPYFKTSANTALAYDVSAALTTVYISITGFKSKV